MVCNSMNDLVTAIFTALKTMDAEATTRKGSFPTGLRWNFEHENPTKPVGRDDTERAWCRRLKVLLPERYGISEVQIEVSYPGGYCDLVVVLGTGECVWIEVKGAWTYMWDDFAPTRIKSHRPYNKHLFSDSGVVGDFTKLRRVSAEQGSYAAVLLIGFDGQNSAEYRIKTDIAKMKTHAGVDASVWREYYDSWPDPHQMTVPGRMDLGFRVQCWLWSRTVT